MNLKWRKYGRKMLHYTLEARTRNKRLKTSMFFWIELTELLVVTVAQDIFLQHLFSLFVNLTWLSLHRMALKKRVITSRRVTVILFLVSQKSRLDFRLLLVIEPINKKGPTLLFQNVTRTEFVATGSYSIEYIVFLFGPTLPNISFLF